jgi:protein-disulfide isomerase
MRSKTLVSLLLGLVGLSPACTTSPTGPQPDPAKSAATPEAPPVPQTRYLAPVRADDPSLGGAAPLVTVVVFSDYACPPCGRTWKVLDHLLEDYGEDLRVVARTLTVPGFADGERAAEAALAAGAQNQFWPMHQRLFETPRLDRATLKSHAEALGLDVPRFLDDLDLGTFSGPRVQHRREAVELGIYFGPVALVNGRPVVGFRDERAWHALIDEEILAAQARLREGTPRADLYASFQAGALLAPIELPPEAEAARQQLAERFAVDIKTLPAGFQRLEAGKRYMVEAGDAPAVGPVDAPVQLVVFMDYECPFCRRAAQQAFAELRRRYPEDLRLAFRHLPLPIHRSADGAARAAVAADRQGQFWPFSDRLLAPEVTSLGRGTFLAIARDLKLDEARFIADLDGPDVVATVREDMLLARRLGLDATPGFFLNGRYLSGFRDVETLAAEIDAELATTKKLLAEGVPRGELLATLQSREAVQFPNADQ